MSGVKINIDLTPKRLASILLSVVALLLVANLLSIYLKFSLERNHSFFHTFYFDAENNLPTLYSFLTLALCGIMLWMTGSLPLIKTKRQTIFWRILSCIFFFLAVDELTSLHESLTDNARELIGNSNADGYLHFAWVLPYGIFFAFIAILLVKQFRKLPTRTQLQFALAAIVYVFGAVAMEMIGGRYVSTHGGQANQAVQADLYYALLTTLEELLEMIGIIIFLYAISGHYLKHTEGKEVELKVLIKQDTDTSLARLQTPLAKANDEPLA